MFSKIRPTKSSNSAYVFNVRLTNGTEQMAVVHSPSAMYDEAKGRLIRYLKKASLKYDRITLVGQSNTKNKVLLYGI